MKIKYSCKKKKESGPGDYVLIKNGAGIDEVTQIISEYIAKRSNAGPFWRCSNYKTYFKWRVQRLATPEEIIEFKSKNNIS